MRCEEAEFIRLVDDLEGMTQELQFPSSSRTNDDPSRRKVAAELSFNAREVSSARSRSMSAGSCASRIA